VTRSLAILAGGAAGTLARWRIEVWVNAPAGHWPWATLAVNLAGTFLLGWLSGAVTPDSVARALVGTGFCGALTTFSSFQVETLHIADDGRVGLAAAYAAVSLALGVAAALAGRALAGGRPG
jgi:fluoride exporter